MHAVGAFRTLGPIHPEVHMFVSRQDLLESESEIEELEAQQSAKEDQLENLTLVASLVRFAFLGFWI